MRPIFRTIVLVIIHTIVYLSVLWALQMHPSVIAVVVLGLLVWISVYDFQRHEIPDLAAISLAIIASYWLVETGHSDIKGHFLGAIAVSSLFYGIGALYFKYRGVDGLGIGDAKLMFGLGLLVGPNGLTFLVLMASVSALTTIIVFSLGWWHKNEQLGQLGIAFGPFLCLPAWGLWLFQG